jgi:hypothetical protein
VSNDKIEYAEHKSNSMRSLIVAVAAACLSWGAATAQTGPPAPPAGSPQPAVPPFQAPPPEGASDVWSHMTGEQRRQAWQQLTPEDRAKIWARLPPEQRRAIRERLAPDQRAPAGPGPKLSPEERRRLREEIRDAHVRRGRPGKLF